MSEVKFAFLAYDVPTNRRSAYNTLRRAMRRIAVPTRTWSVYLINYARRDEVEQAISALNEDQPKDKRIRFDIAKFDDSEDELMQKWVFEGIVGLIKQARETLSSRIKAAEEKLAKAEEEGKDAGFTLPAARRIAARKARATLSDARVLAEQFKQTGNLDTSFDSFLKVVKAEEELAEANLAATAVAVDL